MKFTEIIGALEQGKVARRSNWLGQATVVFKQVPAQIEASTVLKMQSLPEDAKEVILKTAGHINYTSQCLIYNTITGRADSWSPSDADIFADDWNILDVQ